MADVRASPRLGPKLAALSRGRALVIDYFASARCGPAVGDVTAGFVPDPSTETYARMNDLQGVPVFAERRLVPLLEETTLVLDLRRLSLGDRLAVYLEPPERWLEFLERPGVLGRATPDRQGG